ncbi:MAG: hypothetical protein ACOYKZ_07560 [Chlamydiia bacterium]
MRRPIAPPLAQQIGLIVVLVAACFVPERSCWPDTQAPLSSHRLDADRKHRQPSGAVRDLPEDEQYPEHEIENRKSDRRDGALDLGAGLCISALGIARKSPGEIATGAFFSLKGGDKVLEAQKDIFKMERHNDAVKTRKESTRDSRWNNNS